MSVAPARTARLDECSAEWSDIGCLVRVVVTDRDLLWVAAQLLADEIKAIDLACSRFRVDSELMQGLGARGAPVTTSPLFRDAVAAALWAAEITDGLVDPTVGNAVAAYGYDRDFASLPADGPLDHTAASVDATWRDIRLDRDLRQLRVPAGVQLDLGATAKALAADRAAAGIARVCGCGVLVSLGGDISIAGEPPTGGWSVRVQERPGPLSEAPNGSWCVVSLHDGGLATSSVLHRRWRRGGRSYHHIVDPRTGQPADSPWRTVSVTAATCVDANAASTAAIVMGEQALEWLRERHLPARLVRTDGEVLALNGWPGSEA
jgi:thiamine biosynthesis lipoprotein ApbE